jgi:nuclear GTP-binding protein
VASISKKGQWREVKKVVDLSDVIIQVIDARDPISGRCKDIEDVVKEHNKKIIFVLNKTDLIPNASDWVKYFKNENQTCIEMQAKITESKEVEESLEKLMTLLFKYAKKFEEKKSKE